MARERPAVVARRDIVAMLDDAGSPRDADRTVRELQRLGWFKPLHLKGVWAYLPPGEGDVIDPYIDLRGWLAREPNTAFALAGEAAAWHLGYLDRSFGGSVAVWIPDGSRLPHGLRPRLSVISLGLGVESAPRVGPTTALLHKRRLDATQWADGLPAFGPEALLVQLSARPTSFRAWADLVPHLEQLAADCDIDRLVTLLSGQSSSAWQRASYVLDTGGRRDAAVDVLGRRPMETMSNVQFGTGPTSVWVPAYRLADRLIKPRQSLVGKA